jgi:hypothetical protein
MTEAGIDEIAQTFFARWRDSLVASTVADARLAGCSSTETAQLTRATLNRVEARKAAWLADLRTAIRVAYGKPTVRADKGSDGVWR